MTTFEQAAAMHRRRKRVVHTWGGIFDRVRLVMLLFIAASVFVYFRGTEEQRLILGPMLVEVNIATLFILILFRRDRRWPVFDVGALWMLVAVLYAAFPLLNYYAAGLRWVTASDGRLQTIGSTPQSISAFAWRFVAYMLPFAIVYLLVRGRARVPDVPVEPMRKSQRVALFLLLGTLLLFLVIVGRMYNVSFFADYGDILSGRAQTIVALPFFLLQIVHNVMSICSVLIWCCIAVLMRRWDDWKARVVLVGFLAYSLAYATLTHGERTSAFLCLLVTILYYHRLVRPLTFRLAATLFLGAFMMFNAVGTFRARSIVVPYGYDEPNFLTNCNEFQVVFGTAYDLWDRQEKGILPPVPFQITYGELLATIPGQLLPFPKMDPSSWYCEVSGLYAGFMYGAISQGVVGFDWLQLAMNGAAIALIFGLIHRWYVRNAHGFWPSMFYVFLCVWTYYSMRQTTFAALSFVEYWFVPPFLLITFIAFLLRRVRQTSLPAAV
jgi:hypothetical protein